MRHGQIMRRFMMMSAAMAIALAGCQENPSKPSLLEAKDRQRDPVAARAHNEAGLKLLESNKLADAEKKFELAIAADAFFGQAHNNLGVVHFRQKRYYDAATEFQYAAKFMPKRAQPIANIGLVYETVGKFEEAAKSYEDALSLDSADTQATANLARVYVRLGHKDSRTRQLLDQIVLKDPRKEWTQWAQEQLALFNKKPTTQE